MLFYFRDHAYVWLFFTAGFRVKVAFTDIPKAGNRYEISDDAWFPESELYRIAPVQAELVLNRKGDNQAVGSGFPAHGNTTCL